MEDNEFESPNSKKGKMSESYELRCALKGHADEVRVVVGAETRGGKLFIVSGSRDTTARVWMPGDDGNFEVFQFCEGQTKLVSCICVIPPSERHPTGLIYTGGHDNIILGYELGNAEPLYQLTGHTGVVCCIAGAVDSVLVSGSWDKTAKVWSKESNVATLEGHEAPIASVAMIDEHKILTGSADNTIRLWTNYVTTKTFKGHTDCVRALAVMDSNRFLSGSIDCTIRLWNINAAVPVHTYFDHSHLIYSLAVLPNTNDFVSVSRDHTLRIWRDNECEQVIHLPAKYIWSVACLKNGDIVTGSSDGIIRIFTTTEERKSDPAILEAFAQEVAQFQLDIKNEADLNKVPPEGQAYDYEFITELDDEMEFKLPYNVVDDPWDVASEFIHTHNLNRLFLEQIADFIIDNSMDKSFGRWGQGNPNKNYGGNCDTREFKWANKFYNPAHTTCTNSMNGSTHFPMNNFLRFAQKPIYKSLRDTLTNFIRLRETCTIDEEHVESLLEIGMAQRWDSNSEKVVDGALNMRSEHIYPILELLRVGVLNPAVAEGLNKSLDLNSLSEIVCKDGRTDELNTNPKNQMLMIKILCNCFGVLTNYLMENRSEMTNRLLSHLGSGISEIAAATLFLNYTISVTENMKWDTKETKTELLRTGCKLATILCEPESLYRLFTGFGNIVHNNEEMIQIFKELGGEHVVEHWLNCSESDKTKACARQILKCLVPM